VVMTQVFVIIAGVTLLDGHRPEWGVPALLLAVGCLAAVFTPASLRALNRPSSPPPAAPAPQSAKNPSAPKQPAKRQPAKRQPANKQPANKQPAKRQPAK
jgi:hypothetical protein